MTAIVLPDVDRSTFEDLKARIPSLGRSGASIWPFLAVALGLAAILGSVAVLLTWSRRPGDTAGSVGTEAMDLEAPQP